MYNLHVYFFLDAKESNISAYRREGRYKNNKKNKKIFKVKAKSVQDCMYSLLNINCVYRAIKVLHIFFKHFCYLTNEVIICYM